MDAVALEALEFPAIAARLAAAAETPYGARQALALEPSAEPDEVARRQALTAEAISLLDVAEEVELHGVEDVREAAAHAERGSALEPASLRAVARAVSVGLAARAALASQQELAPLLAGLLEPLDPSLAGIADAIDKAIEEDGSGVRDRATPKLRRLRSELRTGRHRIADDLRDVARSSGLRQHLQEDFVVERGGRPVLAVRASARESVPGIVHDASASGQTLFVEPLAFVARNNALAEAASAEREEVARILAELSGRVGGAKAELTALVEAVGEVDLVQACGALSRRWRGAAVMVSDEVRLTGVRHPLLDPATAVPIDLGLGTLRGLVVSGPNTGGKTVALKTLGLAAALHQAGLRPPADEAVLPVFDRLLADIGDRQSIELSLSTFSGHVRALVEILDAATERSLVLVDELASGTDPVEGAALAQALVARLVEQARLTVVTTHYPELKEWASATDGVANAGTGFDPETHAPLYRIALDRPGTSHALQIAAQLGVDPVVIADARDRIAPERRRVGELVADAEAAEQAAAAAREEVERRLAEAESSVERAREREAELERELDALRASAADVRARALAEAERDLADARAELQTVRDEVRSARRREAERGRAAAASAREQRAARERDRRLGAASEGAARAAGAIRDLERPPEPAGPLDVGDVVEALGIGLRGTIAAIDGEEAEVLAASGARMRVPLDRLRPDARRDEATVPDEPAVRIVASARADVSDELDVRGRSAQEAREAVRSFVDEAALAGLSSVRVIHGRGTGAVRTAVRDELRGHALVERQEPDSADGATVVHLG
jgi:DNA mismatch repair protein MutS2